MGQDPVLFGLEPRNRDPTFRIQETYIYIYILFERNATSIIFLKQIRNNKLLFVLN